jgi:hypothetical protein
MGGIPKSTADPQETPVAGQPPDKPTNLLMGRQHRFNSGDEA